MDVLTFVQLLGLGSLSAIIIYATLYFVSWGISRIFKII